jgi:hypothetical protein
MTFKNGSASSYLVRNPYSYCFRIKVPPDLQGPVGKKELRYSLKTGYRTIAKEKAHYLAGKVLFIFRFLRRYEGMLNTMPDDLIQDLVKQYIQELGRPIRRKFL